jgi:hypothetical protein
MPKNPLNPAADVVENTPAAPAAVEAVGSTPAPTPAPDPGASAGPVLDVAAYQERVYPAPRCWSLIAAVYTELLARDPTEVQTVSESMRQAARTFRLQLFKRTVGLQQIPGPEDFAIVLMWPSEQRKRPHCGIFYGGKVLHATPEANLYQDMASLGDSYPVIEYWAAP